MVISFSALRAFALNHEGEGMCRKAFGQMNIVDMYVFKTERLPA